MNWRPATPCVPLFPRRPLRSVSEKPTYPANLCLFSWWIEFAGFREDFCKTVGESVQTAAGGAIGQVAPGHLHYVLSGKQGVHYSAQAGVGRGDLCVRLRCEVARLRAGQMKLALQISQGD